MNLLRAQAGFLSGVCDHIAVEKTGQMPGSVAVREHSTILQMFHKQAVLMAWASIEENNDIEDVVDHLENLTGDNLDIKLLPQIDFVAGYAIGAACAGYTPMVLLNKSHALDLRSGEFWFVRGVDEESATRLVSFQGEGFIKAIRWAANEKWEETPMFVKGSAIPSSLLLPMPDFSTLNGAFQ